MDVGESLELIRPLWLSEISDSLAQIERVRASFLRQLNQFYDMLVDAVEVGEPARMELILEDWVLARPQTDLDQRESSLAPILNQMLIVTFNIALKKLDPVDANKVVGSILPIFTYALEYTSNLETKLHVEFITKELQDAKVTLERLEKSKSDFISVAAHELKTPLTLIEGYTSMIQEALPDGDEGVNAALFITGINAGTARLQEIVNDMVDVSLIDNDLLALNFQPLWLNRLLELIQVELKESIVDRQLNLIIKSYPGSDEMIFGDGERLYQAYRNVIMNAIKYTPDGGTITVDGRVLPGFIETIVSDTGIGIDPKDHSRIFEKFGRLGSVSLHSSGKIKFKGGGPGLGLPITKGIIEAHGGTIWVESEGYDEEECPGTTFHILVPQQKSPPDDKAAKLFRPLVEESIPNPTIS
jgi:signal transduction histidine kinase